MRAARCSHNELSEEWLVPPAQPEANNNVNINPMYNNNNQSNSLSIASSPKHNHNPNKSPRGRHYNNSGRGSNINRRGSFNRRWRGPGYSSDYQPSPINENNSSPGRASEYNSRYKHANKVIQSIEKCFKYFDLKQREKMTIISNNISFLIFEFFRNEVIVLSLP